eukprot:s250_g9.t1
MHTCHWIAAVLATLGLAGVAREGAKRAWEPRVQLDGAEDTSANAEQQQHHHHHHHGWHHHWQPATADAEFCSDVMEVKMCHARCGHDGACHKACPMPQDADLQTKLVEKMECHDKCGGDRECHRACGCPFQQLHEKCPMLSMEEHHQHHHHGWHHHWQPATADAEFCSDVMEVKMCHARCGHDGACHKACPMPQDADLQIKLVEKMDCHDKCGGNRECHRACGCPFQQLHEKCPMLNMEERFHHHGWHHQWPAPTKVEFCADVMQVKVCHDNCGLDRHCHKACPLPEDAAFQAKLVETMECHEKCQDGECHRDCGCPFEQVRDRCPMLFAPFTDFPPGQKPDMLMAVHV